MRFLYGFVLKPIIFPFDPEDMHNLFLGVGKFLGKFSLTRWKTRLWFGYSNKMLEQTVLGINFKNPVGLAAGFDKNAELTQIMPSVGFGFEEVGSVTGYPCEGNKRPRLWRLTQSRGYVVYYGLKNNGSEEISERLKNKFRKDSPCEKFPIGVSVAMTNCEENLDTSMAAADYAKAFEAFADIGSYTTVNISCPNAQGGQPFTEPIKLDVLLSKLDAIETKKPIFVKMSPDKTIDEVDAILDVLRRHRVHGIICSNLTKQKNNPKVLENNLPGVGGISGKPLQDLSDDLLSYIYRREVLTPQVTADGQARKFILIGCGGIFSAEDAYKKIRSGATLVQLITGMIFEGPQLISEINLGLVELLRRDGFSNISQAIGADYK